MMKLKKGTQYLIGNSIGTLLDIDQDNNHIVDVFQKLNKKGQWVITCETLCISSSEIGTLPIKEW